jgi:hypothetical protein
MPLFIESPAKVPFYQRGVKPRGHAADYLSELHILALQTLKGPLMSPRIFGYARRVSLVVALALCLTPVSIQAQERPADGRARGSLVPLYASFAGLQVLDANSTLRAIEAGAVERNPLMRGAAGGPTTMFAAKAGAAAATIFLTEQVRKRSRLGAIVLMAAINSAYAAVVVHNYRAGSKSR